MTYSGEFLWYAFDGREILSTDSVLDLVYLSCCLSTRAQISSPSEPLSVDLDARIAERMADERYAFAREDSLMTDRLGEQLGNYRLTKLLGQGGFAEVYLGEHLHLGTQAAIKVLHTRLEPDDLEGFRTEARTIARLEHPNIVRVLEFGIEAGTPFLVMSYAPNGSLRQRHPKGVPLPLPTIVSYVRQVASALQYAHDEKVIHRDVKPENMLVGRHHEVLLSDFGIALIAQSTSSQSKQDVTGTIHYMAPEQIRGRPRPASDQYALAVVVYEWLSGDRPFHGSFTEIATQHMFEPPPPLREKNPTIASALEHAVMTALAKEPHQRWASVQAFATALEQACLPTQQPPIGSPSQPLAPTVAAFPPTQHPWPAIATPPSNRPVQSDVMTPQPVIPQPPKHRITRRTMVVGPAGLVLTGIAGSGLIWVFSHASSGSTATPTATSTPKPPPRGTTLNTYRGHSRKIRALAWSPNGRRIATASDDYTAQVWDATIGSHAVVYRGHSSYVEGVAWSPDSTRVVSGSADGTAQIWDATTGKHLYTYRGHNQWVNRVGWSSDGTRIVSCDQFSGGGTVRVWDASTGNTIVTYRGHTNGVFAAAWSPDGARVASCGYDGTMQVWDAHSGNTIATYRGHSVFLFGLSWSSDGKRIAVGSTDMAVLVLDASNGNIVLVYRGHTGWVTDVAWSPDNKYIAAGGLTIHVINASTGERLYVYNQQPGQIEAVGWSPDSKLVASGNDEGDTVPGTVQVWQAV